MTDKDALTQELNACIKNAEQNSKLDKSQYLKGYWKGTIMAYHNAIDAYENRKSEPCQKPKHISDYA